MPQGVCSCCGEFTRVLDKCPRCGLYIGMCCYVISLVCCIACRIELQEDACNLEEQGDKS